MSVPLFACNHRKYRLGLCMLVSFFFCGEGLRSRCYGHTAALRLIVQPCYEDDYFFVFPLMEHRWNEIDRGKP
jgi:hypothetical protein